MSGEVVGRKIAKNEPTKRPWGIDTDFSCITPDCTSKPWDLAWYDSRNRERKRQYCTGCKLVSPYVAFTDIEGKYANKLNRTHLNDVYWSPWPLPEEVAGLFYLTYGKDEGKRKDRPSDKGKQGGKKQKTL